MLTLDQSTDVASKGGQKPEGIRSKRDAAPHAILIGERGSISNQVPFCPLFVPTIDKGIAQSITLAMEGMDDYVVTDSMLSLAIVGAETPGFAVNPNSTFADNIILAANFAIRRALKAANGTIVFNWWPSQHAALKGTKPCELTMLDQESVFEPEPGRGANTVIEFGTSYDEHTGLNNCYHRDGDSANLQRYEAVCPGFTHMTYTVLDMVSDSIFPIITPRTLWNDYISRSSCSRLCDLDIMKDALNEYSDPSDLEEKYGIEDTESAPIQDIIAAYEDDVAGVLPSNFIDWFGRAAIGAWPIWSDQSPDESIPYPNRSIATDLSIAIQNMELRNWCPVSQQVRECLEKMHKVARAIQQGARMAQGAESLHSPCQSAIQLFDFNHQTSPQTLEEHHFRRVLDDAVRDAWESGETFSAAGWLNAEVSTPERAQRMLSRLESGAAALFETTEIISEQ